MREPIRISILGDICPDWGFRASFDEQNPEKVFGDVQSELLKSDISIGNLEAPASLRGTPIKKSGPCLRCKPEDIIVLKNAGINVLSLANNHIFDFGETALLDTLNAAAAASILTFGAGRTTEDAERPLYLEKKGWRVGLLSFAEQEFNVDMNTTAGANLFDPYSSFEKINSVRKKCDYLIIIYHGGIEHYELPSPLLQKKCRKMAVAGADLIICQHSHCIGTTEIYHGATILYGQGNAVFGKVNNNEKWNTGLLLCVELSDYAVNLSWRLFEAGEGGISFASEEQNRERLERMTEDSNKLNDEKYLKDKWDDFCDSQKAHYYPLFFGWGRIANKLNRMFSNRIIQIFIGRNKKRVSMNLIRCDAHREVIQTILENAQNI